MNVKKVCRNIQIGADSIVRRVCKEVVSYFTLVGIYCAMYLFRCYSPSCLYRIKR